jgi:fatty-acyl-CoA synthase/long-chain acyl-CoA synthetase
MASNPVPDILAIHAQSQPDKLALIDDRPNGTILRSTYGDLNRDSNRLANAMLDLGVRPGDTVVWCGQNSEGVIRGSNAARKIRATAVPLNYRLSPEEAAYVVNNSDAVLVHCDAEYADLMAKIRDQLPKVRHIIIFDGAARPGMIEEVDLVAQASDAEPVIRGGPDEAATMIYTSGTTGSPKGALRRGSGDPEQVGAMLAYIGYQTDDVYITTGPLYHSGPGGFYAVALALGNTTVVQRKFDPEDWLRLVDKYRVTSTFCAPTPIRIVCSLPDEVKARYDRSSMRIMLANAAPWSLALKEMYVRDFPPSSLWEIYGSTELGVNTILRPEDQLRKPGSCGQPSPGVEVQLRDEDGNVIGDPDVPGELYVRSKGVFSSYHKDPEKYDSSRIGEFFSVGDIAYRDEEGYYYICDRKNDMIISGGMNVYPAEIEAALERHPGIMDVAVFGIPSEQWGESVHAVVVAGSGASMSEQDVITFARQNLSSYKIPRSISFADEIPRTGSGKILKRLLREPFWQGHRTHVL